MKQSEQPKNHSRARRVAARLAPTLVLVAIFFLGFLGRPEDSVWLNKSPLWTDGDQFQGNEGESLVANAMLVWRGQPHFSADKPFVWGGITNVATHNELGLRDDPIEPKAPGTTRVLNIGDSSTWGLNLSRRSDTYTDQLEQFLDEAAPGMFDVVNGGTVGYSSLQGLQFYRFAGDEIDPDVLTVYLGNNDSAPARVKDAERIVGYTPLEGWLSKNLFYLLVQKAKFAVWASRRVQAREALEGEMASKETSPAYRSKETFYALRARGTPEEYGENLRNIVRDARANGVRVILLKVPRNVLWLQTRFWGPTLMEPTGFWMAVQVERGYLARAERGKPPGQKPLLGHPYLSLVTPQQFEEQLAISAKAKRANRGKRSRTVRISSSEEELLRATDDRRLPMAERLRARHNYGVARFIAGDYPAARASFEEVLSVAETTEDRPIEPNLAKTQYMLGVTLLLEGDRERAFRELNESRDRWTFAMGADYQRQFDEVVRELEVEWIDLPKLFAEEDPEFQGSALILDWVHPNARGGRVIAEAIGELLLREP